MAELDFYLTLLPQWDRVDRARKFVARRLADCYEAEIIAMVAAELLENAVKYGRRDTPIELRVNVSPGRYCVSVSNGQALDLTNYDRLVALIAWLESFEDSGDAYLEVLQRSADTGRDSSASGGLGLVRIAHEGRCSLAATTSSDGNLTVEATHQGKKEGCHPSTALDR